MSQLWLHNLTIQLMRDCKPKSNKLRSSLNLGVDHTSTRLWGRTYKRQSTAKVLNFPGNIWTNTLTDRDSHRFLPLSTLLTSYIQSATSLWYPVSGISYLVCMLFSDSSLLIRGDHTCIPLNISGYDRRSLRASFNDCSQARNKVSFWEPSLL